MSGLPAAGEASPGQDGKHSPGPLASGSDREVPGPLTSGKRAGEEGPRAWVGRSEPRSGPVCSAWRSPAACVLTLLCLESFVKQSSDPCPLKRSRRLSPQMPSEAVQSFRPPWKRPQLSRNALRVIPEQDRGLASPSFPSRHLPEAPRPPPRTPGDGHGFCPPGPRLSCCSEASPGRQAWGVLRLRRCLPGRAPIAPGSRTELGPGGEEPGWGAGSPDQRSQVHGSLTG